MNAACLKKTILKERPVCSNEQYKSLDQKVKLFSKSKPKCGDWFRHEKSPDQKEKFFSSKLLKSNQTGKEEKEYGECGGVFDVCLLAPADSSFALPLP